MKINRQIHSLALSNGIDYFGIAELKPVYHFIFEHGLCLYVCPYGKINNV